MTELTDLVGLHLLDAVDFETVNFPAYEGASYTEDSQTCRFRLDGVVYAAVEDPSDGYRSSMRELTIVPDAVLVNVFTPIQVLCSHRTKYAYGGEADVLEFIDVKTAKVVLEVGTDNTDDYYPSFVASFTPENMASNIESSK